MAKDRAIERAVAAREYLKGALRNRQWSAYAVSVSLLFVSLLFAAPAIAGRLNEIDGTASADRIRGTSASDRIRGGEGNDVLRGWGGDDRLVGGPGDDVLDGGRGHDTFVCGRGEDAVIVDSFIRDAEQIGKGCEAVILDL